MKKRNEEKEKKKIDKRPDYKTFRKKALENPKVRAIYEALRPEFEVGTDNVFADLKLPNPEEDLALTNLIIAIRRIAEKKNSSDETVT